MMLYQNLKYYLVRIGISVLLLLTFGFAVLFFVHEIAMPRANVDDGMIKATLILICGFFGFAIFGMIGQQRFREALNSLKDIDLKADERIFLNQFDDLVNFTYSSYFRAKVGKGLRKTVVREYAKYLLYLGKEDSASLKIFLKAFLQDPDDPTFRSPLVNVLVQKTDLNDEEIDLLAVMLKAEDYKDRVIFNHIVETFLKRKQFSSKSEPFFMKGLEAGLDKAQGIVTFVLPVLLGKNQSDPFAVKFYFQSLSFASNEYQLKIKKIIARCFCLQKFLKTDPQLHEQCQNIFNQFDAKSQSEVMNDAKIGKEASALGKVRLFTSEDTRELKRLKQKLNISPTGVQAIKNIVSQIGGSFGKLFGVFGKQFVNVLENFVARSLWFKLTSFTGFLALIIGLSFFKWGMGVSTAPPSPTPTPPVTERPTPVQKVAKKKLKIHTIQLAAVTTKNKADRIVSSLRKKKVKGLYIVKVKRSSGGFWYKIRAGEYKGKGKAEESAKSLVENKIISNYFIIPVESGQEMSR